jgi:uncharacterized protein YkwD
MEGSDQIKQQKKKRNATLIVLTLCLIGILAIGYTLASAAKSGDLEARKDISQKLFVVVNENRDIFNVPYAQWNTDLESLAINKSTEYLTGMSYYGFKYESKPWDTEDAFVISKEEWHRSYYLSPGMIFDTWMNNDHNFRIDALNRDYTKVGIGVVSDQNNYYIVFRWQ